MDKRRATEFLGYLLRDKNIERTIYEDALKIAIESLKAQLSKENTTKDAISRQAAIEKFAMTAPQMSVIRIYEAVEILESMPTIQPEPQWIPVGERMPKDYVDVLVWFEYFRYGDYNCMYATHGIGNYSKEYNSWTINHETGWKDLHVFAWMPLPEAYKPTK